MAAVYGICICAALFGLLALARIGASQWIGDSHATALVADQELIVIEPKGAGETTRQIAFRLTNASNHPIRVKRATSACTCMVVKPIEDVPLEPDASMYLKVHVAIAKMGQVARTVRVYHDAASEPLVLQARVHVRRPVPYFARKVNATQIYSDLSSDKSPQSITLETLEKLGSQQWVSEVTCDLEDVTVRLIGVTETPDAQINSVRRRYSWSIGWKQAPLAREVSGRLLAVVASGSEREIAVGQIFARVGSEAPLSPSTVVLSRLAREREIVITEAGAAERDWDMPRDFDLPTWLKVSNIEVDGRKAFEFRLSQDIPTIGSASELVPFVDRNGAKWQLSVRAQFAETARIPY